MSATPVFRLRVLRGDQIAIGPGKVALLEAIAETGSISAAARRFGMSYRRAWLLVDEMNRSLRQPVASTATGGAHGGGATLTETGRQVIAHYRATEAVARQAARAHLDALAALVRPDDAGDNAGDTRPPDR
ncbi:MAG: LysR family transcriptional regulator [Comamonas sp.]